MQRTIPYVKPYDVFHVVLLPQFLRLGIKLTLLSKKYLFKRLLPGHPPKGRWLGTCYFSYCLRLQGSNKVTIPHGLVLLIYGFSLQTKQIWLGWEALNQPSSFYHCCLLHPHLIPGFLSTLSALILILYTVRRLKYA